MRLSRLYIHESVKEDPVVDEIRSRLGVFPRIVKDVREVYAEILQAEDPVADGKSALFLNRNQGGFVKSCPGTRVYTCCGYQILHVGTYCTMDCSYCVLQTYFHPPVLQLFVNFKDLETELNHTLPRSSIKRIGTGEFTDSLIWDRVIGLSQVLVPFFSRQCSCALELKTKTADVSAIADLEHNQKTIVAWSLNTPRIVESEEKDSAPIEERILAAERCEASGYPLAFHFDPLVIYEGCEMEYAAVIHRLFESISPKNIVWISLGAFRFTPDLKALIQKRHGRSQLVYGEFIRGQDGKMRYFKPLRIRLYREMARWIREHAPDVTIYLCMEDDEVWEKALGMTPARRGGLKRMLDAAAEKKCGLVKG